MANVYVHSVVSFHSFISTPHSCSQVDLLATNHTHRLCFVPTHRNRTPTKTYLSFLFFLFLCGGSSPCVGQFRADCIKRLLNACPKQIKEKMKVRTFFHPPVHFVLASVFVVSKLHKRTRSRGPKTARTKTARTSISHLSLVLT